MPGVYHEGGALRLGRPARQRALGLLHFLGAPKQSSSSPLLLLRMPMRARKASLVGPVGGRAAAGNTFAHHGQHIQAGRFRSVEELCGYVRHTGDNAPAPHTHDRAHVDRQVHSHTCARWTARQAVVHAEILVFVCTLPVVSSLGLASSFALASLPPVLARCRLR